MVDRYKQDFKRTQNLHKEIDKLWGERKGIQTQGGSTGKQDYKIRSLLDTFK